MTPQRGRHYWPQEELDESGFVEDAEEDAVEDAGEDAVEDAGDDSGEDAEEGAVEEAEVDPGVAPLQALPQAPARDPIQAPAQVPIQAPAEVPIQVPTHAPADATAAVAQLWDKAMGDKALAAQKAKALLEGGKEAARANKAASKSWSAFVQVIGNFFCYIITTFI